jgi:hypothetical protein
LSFLQPFLLYGLLGASIPVIIHLLNRRRFRTVKWGAMQFILKATRESRGKKRLKHILILICRTLAIAALIVAIARPLVGGLLGWGSGKVDTVILLLDRSASMERSEGDGQPGKRESVLRRISTSMAELGGARLVLIDSGTGKAQEIPSPDVLPELTAAAATDTAADISAMLTTALDYLQDVKPGRSEIWIASDLQKSDWGPEDARWKAFQANLKAQETDVQLRILALNSRQCNDYTITVHSARRESGELVLDLELTREQDAGPTTLPVTYSLQGARSANTVELEGQSLRFEKRLPLASKDSGGDGWVSIPTDTNTRNNVSYYAFGPEVPAHSYLIHELGTSEEALEALTRAAAPGYAQQEITLLTDQRAHLIDFDKAGLIIWKAPLPDGPVAEQLLNYIRTGGVTLFLPPASDRKGSFGGLAWEAVTESQGGRYFIVKEWQHNDGPLRDGADGTQIPLQQVRAIKRRELAGEFTTLASWDDGAPFLVRRIMDAGTVYFLTTLPDYTWSNIEQTAIHLVLIQRAIATGGRRLGAGHTGTAGEESGQAGENEIRSRIDSYAEGTPSNAPFEAGVYKLGERVVSINRPGGEDTLDLLSSADLDIILDGTGYRLFEESASSGDPLLREAWRTFLVAVLFFLIAEALLCLQPRRPAIVTNTSHPATLS